MHELYAKYYPLEISHDITHEQKVKYMEEWWTKAHEHIIDAKITKQNIKQAVKECSIAFRPLLKEFITMATLRKIPLLVFSAGLADVIKEILLKEPGYWTDDMDIVSNIMKFENDVCVGFENRLVHVMNKNEAGLPPKVHQDKVVDRENVILMGDHLGDLQMGNGVEHKVKLTIGFLNQDVEKQLEVYRDAFDIVLTNDTSLEFMVMLLALIS
jgi:5'-nucleotidase